jgi:hypothetical protein
MYCGKGKAPPSVVHALPLFLIPLTRHSATAAPTPPHIVYLMIDDLGWGTVGWNNPAVHMCPL